MSMTFSKETIGFTSALKAAFIHDASKALELNYVPTEFAATEAAITLTHNQNPGTQVAPCFHEGCIVVMTAEESRKHMCPEAGLKLVDNEWVHDPGYMTAGGYKQAMAKLGVDGRRQGGEPLSKWLDITGVSESSHKKYTSGHAMIPRTLALLINKLTDQHD